jgi:UDP-N-acetylglucosamine pyrophosphorylase
MLDKLIADGIQFLFVSNSDNLGATLDLQLLHYFAGSGKAFMMEVGRSSWLVLALPLLVM